MIKNEAFYFDSLAVAETLQELIKKGLGAEFVEVKDESEKHTDHAGARQTGGGHFSALIIAEAFEKKDRIERHQIVYRILSAYLESHIHAFRMRTLTPGVWLMFTDNEKKAARDG